MPEIRDLLDDRLKIMLGGVFYHEAGACRYRDKLLPHYAQPCSIAFQFEVP